MSIDNYTSKGKPKRRKTARRLLLREMREMATVDVLNRDFMQVSPEDALQECLNRAYEYMLVFARMAETIPKDKLFRETINGEILHPVIRAESEVRAEVAYLAAKSMDLGLAERQVQLSERTTDIFSEVIEAVMTQIGLNETQRQAVGPALREQMARLQAGEPLRMDPVGAIESTAHEVHSGV